MGVKYKKSYWRKTVRKEKSLKPGLVWLILYFSGGYGITLTTVEL